MTFLSSQKFIRNKRKIYRQGNILGGSIYSHRFVLQNVTHFLRFVKCFDIVIFEAFNVQNLKIAWF